jgi:starch synthase
MNIVLISAEIVPFSKTGGLADVVGALATTLGRRGHRVMTVSPKYASVDVARHGFTDTGQRLRVDVAWRTWHPTVWRRHVDNVTDVLIESPLFDRAGIYGDAHGAFGDNHVRYALLCRAALEAARHVPAPDVPIGDIAVLHVHDWHASLVPVYVNALYRPLGLFRNAPTVLTLHNVGHQGAFGAERFLDLELPGRWHAPWCLEYHGGINLLKGGVLQAEALTTVSPTYARELLWDDHAVGLDGPLRSRSTELIGILNGIDAGVWNPATDPHLDARYDADDLSGKAIQKAAVQLELGLPVNDAAPLLTSVGRLDPQKGINLLIDSIPWLVEAHGAQIAILGSAPASHRHLEHQLKALEARYPRNVTAWIGFSERMAHRLEAAADLFLMPSLFEPCGLNQLYSLRYGTPPVVRLTGGLADSVISHDPRNERGNGWGFVEPTGEAFREACHWGIHTWRHHPEAFRRLQLRGMREDHSWDAVIPIYEAVYRAAGNKVGMPS